MCLGRFRLRVLAQMNEKVSAGKFSLMTEFSWVIIQQLQDMPGLATGHNSANKIL